MVLVHAKTSPPAPQAFPSKEVGPDMWVGNSSSRTAFGVLGGGGVLFFVFSPAKHLFSLLKTAS